MERNFNLRSKFCSFSAIFGPFFGGLGTKKKNLKQMSPNILPCQEKKEKKISFLREVSYLVYSYFQTHKELLLV